ncbi:TPA: hypothetical protein DD449_04945 [Candidatus Berkelbacteria bacterium]|uniref:Uncharacterized protein n=1 Tax=Berkelbacteria bacterium GW2011_GWE1_39_12 TaxID=1618337 RepID=A0A0G4B3I9_9BACT|nr:MAG: hypothetical protein UT28_C0001G0608 [Berkelbacteria bacterium GW2011_GWE1_39_12]HBO61000.1 hypothetical protein [Candidatus Berkelbacteria bacterium]
MNIQKNPILELKNELIKANSLKWTFIKGIFGGFGFFLGSALFATILLYIIKVLTNIPIVGRFFFELLNLFKQN